MPSEREILSMMTLARIGYYNLSAVRRLYNKVGSGAELLAHASDIRQVDAEASPKLTALFHDWQCHWQRALEELEWDKEHDVDIICLGDDRYPRRLAECNDAPLVMFYRGNANLNAAKVVSIVGTRHCTVYGEDIIRHFIADLRTFVPRLLIVSGLAYGVDICAHRGALNNGFETVAVLAHGLDELYPPRHKATAEQMTKQGGLLTEHFTCTNADKRNFVRRNRIVAGIADATILVESAAHGGGLITCSMANDYNREVFAFPGPVTAPYSEGCNNIIRDNGAHLISNAADFVKLMGWENEVRLQEAHAKGIERSFFVQLSADEQKVATALREHGDIDASTLARFTGIAFSSLSPMLFQMEMKGVVKALPGGRFHLLD
ncbi:MAG: DNA-processing protein DprA [Prevotella sp.]|nr:DNA-processing protein DprA [Prevotella sp.]